MRLFARDNRVLWVNSIGYRTPKVSKADFGRAFRKLAGATKPIREVEPNLFVLNPLAIPVYGQPLLREFNRRWLGWQVRQAMRKLGFQHVINWIFNPAAAVIARAFDEDLLVYYCVDEHSAFTGVTAHSLAEMERVLLRWSDMVVVSADRLYQSKAPFNSKTVLVRHGVDYTHFRRALDAETSIHADIAHLPHPRIGYFGLIAEDWVDIDLLVHVAERFPQGSLIMLGKSTMDVSRLAKLPNVHLLGRKPYADLPAYCKGFDVALIPFPISEVTLNANPLKAREYLAAGLPVVSTAIPEVEVLGSCRIGHDPDEFVAEIEAALAAPGPNLERSESMRSESWEARVEDIRAHMAELLGPTTEPECRPSGNTAAATKQG